MLSGKSHDLNVVVQSSPSAQNAILLRIANHLCEGSLSVWDFPSDLVDRDALAVILSFRGGANTDSARQGH
jgi:hypothetical protein